MIRVNALGEILRVECEHLNFLTRVTVFARKGGNTSLHVSFLCLRIKLRPSAKRAWVGPTSGLALEDFSLARFAQGITVFIRLNATAFIKFFII